MRNWRAAGLAFGLGVGMAAGQAPLDLWWLALPALGGLIHLVAHAQSPRRAALLALFGGAGHFAAALSWIIEPFLVDAARTGWMAPFAVLFLSFGLALFWAAAAFCARGATAPRRAMAFALTLALAELARGYVLTGFPWALPGHIWVTTPLAQLAALIGPNGLTLITTLAAALPLTWGLRRGGAVAAVMLGTFAAFGQWQLSRPMPPDRPVTLRLVQPNVAQAAKWDPDQARTTFDRLLAYTAALPRPDLVIWPETAVPYLLEDTPGGITTMIADAAGGVPVVVGVQRAEGLRGFNSLALIGAGGGIDALYDKHHLVPFGEYIPFGDLAADLFGLRAFAAQMGNGYTAGRRAAVLDLGPALGRILPLICYEAVFPQDLRAAPTRPDWILQITNDAWFGTLTGPYQHLAQARLRAIEQGLAMVRVANTGVSAVIDARGRIIAQIPLGQAATLDAALPDALAAPPYARWGEGPLLLLLAALALALIPRRGRARA